MGVGYFHSGSCLLMELLSDLEKRKLLLEQVMNPLEIIKYMSHYFKKLFEFIYGDF